MNKKVVGFLALGGGVLVLLGYFRLLGSNLPLELIGGIVALLAGLVGLFDKKP